MASIKLGQLLGIGNKLFGSGLPSHPKQQAVALLKENPLEVPGTKEPTAHMKSDPLGFANLYYPSDLGEQTGQGHYILFYSISTDYSKANDMGMNYELGSLVYQDLGTKSGYNTKRLKSNSSWDLEGRGQQPIGQSTRNSQFTGAFQTHTNVTGAVALYMPPGIKTSYSVENGPTELGISGLATGAIRDVVNAQGTEAAIEQFLAGTGSFSVEGAKQAGIAFGEAIGLGDISAAFTKVTGTAINPFKEVVFEKVNNREFNYTFSLIAKNKKEAQDIHKIIKFFKFHMHPELEMSGLTKGRYFRVPSEFEIYYAYNDITNEYLNKISRCVCNGMSVDYGGDQFNTFRRFDNQGAAPVNITMTLNFVETEIMTKERIAEGY